MSDAGGCPRLSRPKTVVSVDNHQGGRWPIPYNEAAGEVAATGEEMLKAALSGSISAAQRFSLRLRDEYRSGRADESETGRVPAPAVAHQPVARPWRLA